MSEMFLLPDLGEGVHEAEILAIPVTVGQSVQEGELLLEVETDKAAVEIPSPVTGTINQIHVQPGDMARVGDVLISFSLDQELQSTEASLVEDTHSQPPPEINKAPQGEVHDRRLPVPASPSTRRLARELGVDLHFVTPTSGTGVVSADDVRNFAKKSKDHKDKVIQECYQTPEREFATSPETTAAESALPDFSQFGSIERHPFRSIRRATANRMAESWARIPHVNCQDIVDITMLEDFRQRHKDDIMAAGGRLTMTVFTLKAVATALKTYPHFNASLDSVKQEIIIKKYFNIGVAVDTEHGLVVPVIRDVDRKSIKELSVELHQLVSMARERKLSRDELIGGSFTITNAGAIGGSHFSAIINHPEIAILGLGQGRMQPAVIKDENGEHTIVPRLMMPIVLCFDHRVVDGANAIRFLQVIIKSLQDPDDLFINMI